MLQFLDRHNEQITIENNRNWWRKTNVPTILIMGMMAMDELAKMLNIF